MNDETTDREETNIEPGEADSESLDKEFEFEGDAPVEDEETSTELGDRPHVSMAQKPPKQGSIWNSPLGLMATVFLAVKVIDLARAIVIENRRSKMMEEDRRS